MLRGTGGEITVETPQTNVDMKKDLKRKVMSGEYSVGQLITPRQVLRHIILILRVNK